MAKNPPMRVLKRDELEFKRLRNNYRSKLRRIKNKTGFTLEDADNWLGVEIPSIRDLKDGTAFPNRKAYNDWKTKIKRVNSRSFTPLQIKSNSKGMKYPEIVRTIGEDTTNKAKQRIQEMKDELSDLPIYLDGEKAGSVKQQQLMLSDTESYGLYEPAPFDIERYSNPKSVQKNIERNRERQDEDYYDERMARMRDNFASIFEGTDDEENDALAQRIKNIFPKDFYEMYLSIPDMAFEDYDSETGGYIAGDVNPSAVFGYYLDLYERGQLDLSLKDIG